MRTADLKLQFLRSYFCAIVMVISLVSCASPQQALPNDKQTILTTARDLLTAAYPELNRKDLSLTMSTTQPVDSAWRRLYGIRFEVTAGAPENETSVQRGMFLFDRQGKVMEAWFNNPGNYENQLAVVQKQMQAHPEWSDAEIASALTQAGAQFGPADQDKFRQAMQLERLQRLLGQFRVNSVEFGGLPSSNWSSIEWVVEVVGTKKGGADYTLIFEPFGGRLTAILRKGHLAGVADD